MYRSIARPLLVALVGVLTTVPAACALLPLFRQPNSSELATAAASGAPLAWSAHQTEDALIVISGAEPLVLACLLDDVDPDSQLQLELSWIVENERTGTKMQHTLTASVGTDVSKQTFTMDIGSDLQPASGVFNRFSGSLLTLVFPTPPLAPAPLSVACDLRLAGALSVRSPNLRLWDERPAANALIATQPSGLACRRTRHRLLQSIAAVTLDCGWLPTLQPKEMLLIEAAVFALYVNIVGRTCAEDWSVPRLQSNSSDPSGFFAVLAPGSGRLHVGWTIEGDGAALQSRLDAEVSGVDLCIAAHAALPSGGRRLRLRWRVLIVADVDERNRTSVGGLGGNAIAMGLFTGNGRNAGTDISIDHFGDPPLPRALPCPYLCPTAAAASPQCKFAWLHSTVIQTGVTDTTVAFQPSEPSLGILPWPHSLLLMPWVPPSNPSPSPLAGAWTCRSVFAADAVQPDSSSLGPVFRVSESARANFCAGRMPRQSVIFLGNAWSARQSLAIKCTVCGQDETVDAQLTIYGSVDAPDLVSVPLTTRQKLPGGGLELGLRFGKFSNDTRTGGSMLVRCRAVDKRGRGAVAFSVVRAVPAPSGAVLDADCGSDASGGCRKFRCRMDAGLAASLRPLPVSVAYLFTQQLGDATPPQQVLASSDHLLADPHVMRLRCTQLIYYSDSQEGSATVGSRHQQFLATDAATAAVHRAVLGDHRFSRLVLAIESRWLMVHGTPSGLEHKGPLVQNDSKADAKPASEDSNVDALVSALLIVSIIAAIPFGVIFCIRGRRNRALAAAAATAEAKSAATGTATRSATTAEPLAADEPETMKRKSKEKSDSGSDADSKDGSKKGGSASEEEEQEPVETSHIAAATGMNSLNEPLGLLTPSQREVPVEMLSSTSTSGKGIPACFAGISGGSAAHLVASAAQLWKMSVLKVFTSTFPASTAASVVIAAAAAKNPNSYRTAHAVVRDVAPTLSSRATPASTYGSGVASTVAAIQPSTSPRHALRVCLWDRPELRAETTTVADAIVDAAPSDEQRRQATSPPQKSAGICSASSQLAEAARLGRCLICQPPRFRLANPGFGVNMPSSSSTETATSAESTPVASPRVPDGTEDNGSAEIDVPASDTHPLIPTFTARSATIAEPTNQMLQRHNDATSGLEDEDCSTRTGCMSESALDDVGALLGDSDEEECRRLILQAVQSAMARSF